MRLFMVPTAAADTAYVNHEERHLFLQIRRSDLLAFDSAKSTPLL